MAIHVNGLRSVETQRNHFRVIVDAGTDPTDLLDPAYWVHVARKLRAGDRIEVLEAEKSWFGEVLVVEAGLNGFGGARVAYVIPPADLRNDAKVEKAATHEVRWGGPNAKWRVVRVKDGTILKDHLDTKEDGLAWIDVQKAA